MSHGINTPCSMQTQDPSQHSKDQVSIPETKHGSMLGKSPHAVKRWHQETPELVP